MARTRSSNKKPVTRSSQANGVDAKAQSTGTDGGDNNSDDSAMNNSVEYRRKQPVLRGPKDVADNLISQPSFSLDEPVPVPPNTAPADGATAHGFFDLPIQDRRNFALLVLLYFLQGIPMGLATGSVPFLLKNHMSYSDIGIFSLASYPYSLKLLWSPIVDAIWSPSVGRRKSWILPIQVMSGIGMLFLGSTVEQMMATTGKEGGPTVWSFTGWWFFLVFMCATQDIAVDGWALTLLTPTNVSYASTAQTVGLTAGQFLSYTVFLAFNSPDFANRYFRPEPLDHGIMTLSGYLTFWGWTYIAVTAGLALFKTEEATRNEDGVWDVYRIMWGILKLKNVQAILAVHLIAKIGFQANDGVTNLKLLEKGFGNENMALTVLIDFPFEIGIGYYAGKWSQQYTPMRLWCWGFAGRLAAAMIAQSVVSIFPVGGVSTWYLLVVIASHVFSTFTNTVMFVAVSAFHANISDPAIGGTYMTLLATVCNLGGTFPRYFVLRLVDAFTVATCHPPSPSSLSGAATNSGGQLITEPFSCAVQAAKERCEAGGGVCQMGRDGYYSINIMCVVVGALTFAWYIRPKVLALQKLPLRAWRLGEVSKGKGEE